MEEVVYPASCEALRAFQDSVNLLPHSDFILGPVAYEEFVESGRVLSLIWMVDMGQKKASLAMMREAHCALAARLPFLQFEAEGLCFLNGREEVEAGVSPPVLAVRRLALWPK